MPAYVSRLIEFGIVVEVKMFVQRIGSKETKAIARFVAGLKEPEET